MKRRLIFYEEDQLVESCIRSHDGCKRILSFGHDLIEEQRSEEEMQDMVREEVQRQLAEKNL